LDGGAGVDTMIGGDDTYYLRDAGDLADETGTKGTDTILTWVSAQASANIENVSLTATAVLQGNTLANKLTGNMASNVLYGGQGNDTLIGLGGDDTLNAGTGRDVLVGGDGSDTYILNNLYDWRIDDTVRETAAHSGIDHVISNGDVSLRSQHIENITIIGTNPFLDVHANDLDNVVRDSNNSNSIYTYDGDDLIHGRAGNDSISAGGGDDTLLGGTDDDYLDGGGGADLMSGGIGNDTYFIDDIGDQVIEGVDEGTDLLYSSLDVGSLAQAIEGLSLNGNAIVGNGNSKNNRIDGNGQDNLLQGLDGDDTLDGSAGHDTLKGGAGNDLYLGSGGSDTYFMMDEGDNISAEYRWSSGSDTVVTNQNVTFGYYSDIENIRLLGSDDLNAVRYEYGYHQGELRGNAGNNLLDGSDRATDIMLGGLGDDAYVVENTRDRVIEGANAGDDMLRSTVNFSLPAHVERLKLEGNFYVNGFGNGLDNIIVGNNKDDRIAGREGNDTISGGAGIDTFVFDRALGADNVDTLRNFNSAADTIQLRATIFTGLESGGLAAGGLRGGTDALDVDDRNTGQLWFDEDGTGAVDKILFAELENKTQIALDDFIIF
jgi:Ca2+-binding RTX toxin-like protein